MNIIEAREAAMAGKTVISPGGLELVADDFDDMKTISHDMVFGEWEIKQGPVVFEALVERANNTMFGRYKGLVWSAELEQFIGKKVRVTVEVVE